MTIGQIQHLLAFLGYDAGAADGLWGPKTQGAVVSFQKDAGLTPDGYPGKDTQKALRQAVTYGMPEAEEADTGTFWDGIRYFTRAEFACKCGLYHAPYCDGYPAEMDERVVRLAEAVREHFGRPAYVVSGLRCRQHNADSGGVSNSQHMYGEACDLRVEGIGSETVLSFVNTLPGVRYAYAINASNVHFDVQKGER